MYVYIHILIRMWLLFKFSCFSYCQNIYSQLIHSQGAFANRIYLSARALLQVTFNKIRLLIIWNKLLFFFYFTDNSVVIHFIKQSFWICVINIFLSYKFQWQLVNFDIDVLKRMYVVAWVLVFIEFSIRFQIYKYILNKINRVNFKGFIN